MTRFLRCPLCGNEKLELLYGIGDQVIDQCPGCALVFLNPQPACPDEVLYAEPYYRGACAAKAGGQENVLDPARVERRLESCRGVLEVLEETLGGKGRVLDLGCGPGFLLKAAQEAGWEVTGADVSGFAAAYAREQFGIQEVYTGPLEGFEFQPASFDVVTLQHVIEHFRDPFTMVGRIRGWLKTEGILWIETPDIDSGQARREQARWAHIKVPEHLFYFSERTLRRLLTDHGFEVLTVRREVAGTGLLDAACGGRAEARRFYERLRGNPVFRRLVRAVRYANELYRARLKGESDVIRVLARKVPIRVHR